MLVARIAGEIRTGRVASLHYERSLAGTIPTSGAFPAATGLICRRHDGETTTRPLRLDEFPATALDHAQHSTLRTLDGLL